MTGEEYQRLKDKAAAYDALLSEQAGEETAEETAGENDIAAEVES